jgi:PAS domain S-box-containing protein
MSTDSPVFDSAVELAKALFGARGAFVALADGERLWLSSDPLGPRVEPDHMYAAATSVTQGCLWVEDAREHPDWSQLPNVAGPPYFRSFVGAPIRLGDGTMAGCLCVIGRQPKPYDAAMEANLMRLAAFVGDECERSRDELALRSTRETLSAFVQSVPVSLMMTDKDLRLIQASPRWLADMDFKAEDVFGRSIYEIDASYFPNFRRAYDRCLAGHPVATAKWLSRRGGKSRWMRSELTPWRDLNGQVGGLIASAIDISDMVEAIDRIERSEQRLKMAMEIAQVYVWEVDYERGELTKSGGEDQFFDRDFTYEELAEDAEICVDPRDRIRISDAWNKAVDEDLPYHPEYRTARSDGQEVWATCTVKLVKNDAGEPLRLVGAMRNITEQKKVEAALVRAKEEAEEANRAKSAFLATMSHEIRTPLNGVLGMAQAIAQDTLTPVQRERLDVVRQSGEALLAILNDVLDLSKIEAGKLELEVTEFDLASLARGAHAAFTSLANKKGIEFDLVIDPFARGVYRGDSTRIRQIVYNLVSNAVKFTDQGAVSVHVSRMDDELKFTIKDSGIGIPPQDLGRLFRKFEQADASTTRRFGGTGLGLAICRELTQLMGGHLGVDSAVGHGATFWVELPLERIGDERVDVAPATIEEAPDHSAQEIRVLCAEDNPVNQLVLKTLLHQAGIEPVIVDDGAQLVEAWRREDWDILLVDVQMPVLDGPGATREIRTEEARTGRRRTPIVALTANAMSHQVSQYLAAGMDAFVAKPIDVALLFATIEDLLEAADEPSTRASA